MKNTFRRWQQEHQYTLISSKNRIIIKAPIQFELRAQKVKTKWHLPFKAENSPFINQTFELPTKWLCLSDKLSYDK